MSDEKSLTIMRYLPVKLDQYRTRALQSKLVEGRMEELRITEHLKNVADSLKAKIKEEQKCQTDCARALHAGFEMQDVACEHVIDLAKASIQVLRIDTQQVIEDRAMTADEIKHYTKKPVVVKP